MIKLILLTLAVISQAGDPESDAQPPPCGKVSSKAPAPVCIYAPGDPLPARLCFELGAWGEISAELKRQRAELAAWPKHCDELRAADSAHCEAKLIARDAERDAMLRVIADAVEVSQRQQWIKRATIAAITTLSIVGATWCALRDEPGRWPCWASAGMGAIAIGVTMGW